MTLAISLASGTVWFTHQFASLADLKGAIDREEVITCWYFMTHGQRVQEEIIFKDEHIMLLRTEGDD